MANVQEKYSREGETSQASLVRILQNQPREETFFELDTAVVMREHICLISS